MKKIIKRVIAGLLLLVVITITGLVTLMVFPQSLFASKLAYKNFRVYSDTSIDHTGIRLILDSAYSLTQQSELHDPAYVFDIFISDGNIFNKIEGLQGKGPVARATAGNIAVKVPLDIDNNLAIGGRSKINLTELLAHEMVHILQANRYGLINFSPVKHPPMWKLEGYPEYVSRQGMISDDRYSLVSQINTYNRLVEKSNDGFVEVVKGHYVPLVYYKGRLMIEYLIDMKGFTYDQILNDAKSEEQVFKEMLNWADK